MLDRITRTERKLTKWLPKATLLQTSPKITSEHLATWRKLCHFSQYRLEAFGSRDNQLECEAKGETVGAHDPRYIAACGWLASIFLHEVLPKDVKALPDWLSKAKISLAVVVDLSIDEYSSDHNIYSEYFLNEAIQAVAYCVKHYDENMENL